MTCKRIHYRGIVQGVGFRITTLRIADEYDVTGYVQNLPDGRVEVVVAGDAAEVDRFLAAVAQRMASYIHEQDIQDQPWQDFDTFEIRT